MGKDITVVTSFHDIGRGNWHPTDMAQLRRSNDRYFDFFTTLAELKNPMAIVTSAQFADRVIEARKKFGLASDDMTRVIIKELPQDKLNQIETIITNPAFQRFLLQPNLAEFTKAGYSLVTNLKSQFVMDAINSGFVRTSQTAWIDFGYCREPNWFNATKPWEYDFGDKINLWFLRNPNDPNPIFEIIRHAVVFVMGCHIVGPTSRWQAFNESWQKSFESLLELGMTDDDQTMQLMAYRKNPENFIPRMGRDSGPNSWYYILREFNENHEVYVAPQPGLVINENPAPTITFDASVLKM